MQKLKDVNPEDSSPFWILIEINGIVDWYVCAIGKDLDDDGYFLNFVYGEMASYNENLECHVLAIEKPKNRHKIVTTKTN